jgi:hypothetical protein
MHNRRVEQDPSDDRDKFFVVGRGYGEDAPRFLRISIALLASTI